MKNRHPFQERFNDFIYHLARCVEIIFAIIILGTIACQAIPLVHELTRLSFRSLDMDIFSEFLSNSLALVVGLEFVKMLCKHSAQTVVDVLMFAIARQMVVEHLSTLETLIGVVAIAILFAVRKFLLDRSEDTEDAPAPSADNHTDAVD